MKREKFSIIYSLAIMLFAIAACSPKENVVNISGNLSAYQGEVIHLALIDPKESYELDSTILKENGAFYFQIESNQNEIYRLYVKGVPAITLTAKAGNDIKVVSQEKGIKDLKIEGAVDANAYVKVGLTYGNSILSLQKLIDVYKEEDYSPAASGLKTHIDRQIRTDIHLLREENEEFINEYPSSLLSIMALYQRFSGEALFDIDQDSSLFLKVDSAVLKNDPNNPHAIYLHKKISTFQRKLLKEKIARERIQVGKQIPLVSLPQMDREKLRIGDSVKYNRLIYFWTSRDEQSRTTNYEIAQLFKDSHLKKEQLLCISMDLDRIMWKGAVERDALPGIQASELQGRASIIAGIYNVPDQLPYFIEIDGNGKILYVGEKIPRAFFKQ